MAPTVTAGPTSKSVQGGLAHRRHRYTARHLEGTHAWPTKFKPVPIDPQEERQVPREVVQSSYRKHLYGVGVESGVGEGGRATRCGFAHDEAIAVLKSGGRLPMWQALRCRVRYLTDGAIFGAEQFVERVFQRNRDLLASSNRDSGPRAMRGSQWRDLRTLRDLRVNVFS